MGTSPTRVMASVVAVAILAFRRFTHYQTPPQYPQLNSPAPSTEAPLSAPPAEKAARRKFLRRPPKRKCRRCLLRPKPCHF